MRMRGVDYAQTNVYVLMSIASIAILGNKSSLVNRGILIDMVNTWPIPTIVIRRVYVEKCGCANIAPKNKWITICIQTILSMLVHLRMKFLNCRILNQTKWI